MVPLRVVLIFLLQTFLCGALDGSSFSPQDGDVLAARMERSLLQLGQTSLNSSSSSQDPLLAVSQNDTVETEPLAYLLLWKRGADASEIDAICQEAQKPGGRFGGNCTGTFGSLITGFSGRFSQKDLQAVKAFYKSSIAVVERDLGAVLAYYPVPLPATGEYGLGTRRKLQVDQSNPPSWGLDAIDQKGLPLNNDYTYYGLGTGVSVYVVDTGIRFSHKEFLSLDGTRTRAIRGWAFDGSDGSDCHGHGTHTAATIGGLSYGVAKDVTLVSVKAMGCNGLSTYDNLVKALNWISKNAKAPAIVSMSVTGMPPDAYSVVLNTAATRLVEEYGIPVIVASGNFNSDACTFSPPSADGVVAVGGIDNQDRRYYNSNWGPCADIFAPGVNILSAAIAGDTSSTTKTGTSMACPHVSGVAALYMANNTGASPAEIQQKMNAAATPNLVTDDQYGFGTFTPAANPTATDESSTPNRVLYAFLFAQAWFSPGIVTIQSAGSSQSVTLALNKPPTQSVSIAVSSPKAWDGSQLATISPTQIWYSSSNYYQRQTLTITPSGVAEGNYFVTLTYTSGDPAFSGGIQTVRIIDPRPLTGETTSNPRVITSLPFSDSDDTFRFSDDYHCLATSAPQQGAPDVVYMYKPTTSGAVTISTCGSSFDTVLYIFTDSGNAATYQCNDDTSCSQTGGPVNSKITTTLQAWTTYYIVVDGSNAQSGQYKLSIS